MKKKGDTQKQNLEVEEYKNKYLRALADYENLERRTQAQVADITKKANKHLVIGLLEVLDDMENAQEHIANPGFEHIVKKFATVLSNAGVSAVDVEGHEFDPYSAEAIDVVVGKEDNIVTKVVQKGYTMGNEVIRPARVIVTKKNL